jgi:hypothetical protein
MNQDANTRLDSWIDSGFGQTAGAGGFEILKDGGEEPANVDGQIVGADLSTARMSQGARILRWIGASTLIVSAVVFVSQRWDLMDSILRYYSFLGFTAVLAGTGLFCGVVLKEAKGARTLLALAAAFLPAHFAQIGALIHSQFGDIFPPSGSIMLLNAGTHAAAFKTLFVALAVLVPIAYLGLASMARRAAPALTGVFLLSNAALLIPVRQPDLAAVIGSAMFGSLLILDRRLFSADPTLKSWDGRAVRTMLFVPLLVLAVRNIISYEITSLFVGFLAALIGMIFDLVLPSILPKPVQPASRFVGFGLITFAWIELLGGLVFGFHPLFPRLADAIGNGLYIPLNVLPVSALLLARSARLGPKGRNGCWNASVIAIGSCVFNLMFIGGLDASFLCLIVSIGAIIGAFTVESRSILYVGALGFAVSLLYYLIQAWRIAEVSPWLALAIVGTTVVVFSSYIERNQRRLFTKFNQFKRRVLGWS